MGSPYKESGRITLEMMHIRTEPPVPLECLLVCSPSYLGLGTRLELGNRIHRTTGASGVPGNLEGFT